MKAKLLTAVIAIFGGSVAIAQVESKANLGGQVGKCVITTVSKVTGRLGNIGDGGTVINFSNGAHLVSYDQISAADESKIGDGAMICMVRVDGSCPANSGVGLHVFTNLRTLKSGTLGSSQHQCNGA